MNPETENETENNLDHEIHPTLVLDFQAHIAQLNAEIAAAKLDDESIV